MKISKRNRGLVLAIFCLVIGIGIYQFKKTESNTQKINNDPAEAVAEITNLTINGKSKGVTITYAFKKENDTYFEDAFYSPLTEASESLLNRRFPVIYCKNDPKISKLLVIEKDYKDFDKEQPDSLKKYNALYK